MKRIILIAAFFALLAGCATQNIVQRELSGIPDNWHYRDKPVIMIFPIFLPFSLGFK